jgi:hypothetical protein
LRRGDWRFLLGSSNFSRVATQCTADLDASVRGMSASVTDLEDGDEPVDLAVLSNPTAADLARAHRRLVDGGALYVEWNRPSPAGISRHRRALLGAGFVDADFYWLWPSPRRGATQIWLPLYGDGARAHALASRRRPSAALARTVATIRARAWAASRRSGALAPIAAVAWKRAGAGPEPASLTGQLLERWEGWGLGPRPAALSCVVQTSGQSDLNKLVVFAFAAPDTTARIAVKLARNDEANRALDREATLLRAVEHSAVHHAFVAPKVVFHEPLAGSRAVGETVVDGERVAAVLNRSTERQLTLAVAEALRELVAGVAARPASAWWSGVVEPVLSGFEHEQELGVARADTDLVRGRLERLSCLPVVVEHRDCSPWNVLLTREQRLALLDWESAVAEGLPVLDLVYFLANARFLRDRVLGTAREIDSYRRMLLPGTAEGALFAEANDLYVRGTPLERVDLAPLRAFTWMVHALAEHRRLGPPTAGVTTRGRRESTFLRLFREEVSRLRETGKGPT